MNDIVRKTIIYSLAGIMQIGLGIAVTEASPVPAGNWQQQTIRMDQPQNQQGDHDKRLREEKQRHENEMKRRPNEGEKEWHERQERENQRHEQALREMQ